MNKLLYVNQNLKVETDLSNAVAVVAFFKEDVITGAVWLDDLDLNRELINITFLKPIGHYQSLYESLKLQKKWQEHNYPQYHSTLVSKIFCKFIERYRLLYFDECWTRSRYNEGYPQYRTHPEAFGFYGVDAEDKLPNVYVSLVMTKEDFIKINSDIVPERMSSDI